jgi:oxygen-dependent protoporphyrinogen oxidase
VLDKPPVRELLGAAALADRRELAAPAANRRWIWWKGGLQQLPSGPGSFLRSGLFPLSAKLALLREPFVRQPPAGVEESIAAFVRRRLGKAWLERAVAPFVSGVYAGDPERLSVRWAVPRLYALERDHGGLIRGALAKRKGPAPSEGMLGFRGGFEELAKRLALRVGDVRTDTPVSRLRKEGGGFVLQTPAGDVAARQVVLALPAEATAELLAWESDGASMELAEVPYAPVAVACLGYRRQQVAHPLDGFGFLTARGHGLRVLGCLFTSSLFRDRAPAGHVALTAFIGGTTDAEGALAPTNEVLNMVRSDLAVALGVSGAPVFQHLERWPRAIPQCEVGHGRFVDLGVALEASLPGLFLAGSWSGGVSLPDSIARGAEVAARVLAVREQGEAQLATWGEAATALDTRVPVARASS